jgi:predicted Zn-dependent protease
LLVAEMALAMDDVPKAAAALAANDAALQISQGKPVVAGRPEQLLAASVALRNGRPDQAVQQLQTWVAQHPRDARAWQILSGAYASQGQTLRAIRADAESQMAQMDYAAAQDRFKAAQEVARELARKGTADHIEASIIDTRSRQVALLLREQAVER